MKRRLLWMIAMSSLSMSSFSMIYLPNIIPIHYNAEGMIDGWGSKYNNLIFPGIMMFLALLAEFCLWIFRRRKSVNDKGKEQMSLRVNGNVTLIILLSVMIFLFIQQFCLQVSQFMELKNNSTHMELDLIMVNALGLGVIMIVMGNVMAKTKMNKIVGLRTPWTLKNEQVWVRSNRLFAKILVGIGCLTIVVGLFEPIMALYIFISLLLLSALGGMLYSYLLYKKIEKKNRVDRD